MLFSSNIPNGTCLTLVFNFTNLPDLFDDYYILSSISLPFLPHWLPPPDVSAWPIRPSNGCDCSVLH